MTQSNNLPSLNVFSAWLIGAEETKQIFYSAGDALNFNKPGFYVGFIKHSRRPNGIPFDYVQPLLESSPSLKPATKHEVLEDGFIAQTFNMGCTVFWFTDEWITKPELQFLEYPYVVMELKVKEPVDKKPIPIRELT